MQSDANTPNVVSLSSVFENVLDSLKQPCFSDNAFFFEHISSKILDEVPPVPFDVQEIHSFALMLLLTSIHNARTNTPIVLEAIPNSYTIDFTATFTPNPMFVLLTKGTRESLDKTLDPNALINASDPFASFHMARILGMRHQVNLWVETIPPDKAIIHAYFPINVPHLPEEGKQPNVLIIEDNRQIGMLLELYLKHVGCTTTIALNGINGIELAKEKKPDLITLDVMMPEMDGWQALRELKTSKMTRNIPVIVISVLRDVQVGFEFGASDYLTKPVNRNDLIASVKRLTAKYADKRRDALYNAVTDIHVLSNNGEISTTLEAIPGIKGIHRIESSNKIVQPEIIEGMNSPDMFVIDVRSSLQEGLIAASRIRLHSVLDTIPIVAVCNKEQLEFYTNYTSGIFDAVTHTDVLGALFQDTDSIPTPNAINSKGAQI